MEIAGRAALVTGGGTGLGREITLHLARRGARVGIVYSKSQADAQRTAEDARRLGTEAEAFRADVSLESDARRVVAQHLDRFGQLALLVNNAGTTKFVAFPDLEGLSGDEWDRIQAVNVKGPWLLARAAAPALRDAGGAILNVASVAGLRPGGSSIAYCVSKAALIHLTSCLAVALAPEVRVNGIAPGLFLSRWVDGLSPQRIAAMEDRAVLKRATRMEDLARMAVEIALNDSMTGEMVVVDAGISLA